jgi:hypothetical protein
MASIILVSLYIYTVNWATDGTLAELEDHQDTPIEDGARRERADYQHSATTLVTSKPN